MVPETNLGTKCFDDAPVPVEEREFQINGYVERQSLARSLETREERKGRYLYVITDSGPPWCGSAQRFVSLFV